MDILLSISDLSSAIMDILFFIGDLHFEPMIVVSLSISDLTG